MPKPCDHVTGSADTASPMAVCCRCGKLYDIRGVRSRYERIASDHPIDDPIDPRREYTHTITITSGATTSGNITFVTGTGSNA